MDNRNHQLVERVVGLGSDLGRWEGDNFVLNEEFVFLIFREFHDLPPIAVALLLLKQWGKVVWEVSDTATLENIDAP